jgi:osmotically-inducible protein OsmY
MAKATSVLLGCTAAALLIAGCGQNNRGSDTTRTDTPTGTTTTTDNRAPGETTGSMAPNAGSSEDQQKLASKLVESRVKASVLDQLQADASDVSIDVDSDGAVKLSGSVNKADDQKRAEQAATGVPGVTRVTNDIKVISPHDAKAPSDRSVRKVQDQMLENKVRASLLEQLGTRGLDITVKADNGQITLSVSIARGIAGVQGVQDKLDSKS